MDKRVINDYIRYWSEASVQVLDIQHKLLNREEQLQAHRLRDSAFIYAVQGNALIQIDQVKYEVDGFGLIHSGKGAMLEIIANNEVFEFYAIYYKGFIPVPKKLKEIEYLKQNNPFQKQYSFTPSYPVTLLNFLQAMNQKWYQSSPLARFNIKNLFYQFMNDVLVELDQKSIKVKEPNLPAQVLLYIEENYSKPLNLELLAETFNYSAPHLSVMFKHETNFSPIDYLIRIRLKKAAKLLKETNASLREIARSVGYKDVYYFSRLFKKRRGLSPTKYRIKVKQRDSLKIIKRYSIVDLGLNPYIDNNYHFHYIGREDLIMRRIAKLPLATSLLVFITLLLTACSGNTAGNATANKQDKVTAEAKTKVVATAKGEVEIPVNPEKIVTDYYPGFLLALGIKPIGTQELYMKSPYLKKYNKDITFFEESLEAVVDLNPELIITGNEEQYDAFSKIAPTVYIPITIDMEETLNEFAKVLDKKAEEKAWLADYHKRVEIARKTVSGIIDKGETVTVYAGGAKDDITLYGNGYTGQSFYEGLQLNQPKKVLEDIDPKQPWIQISPEVLPEYSGDYIFMAVDKKVETYDYKNKPVWRTLPAVKNDKIFEIDSWSFWFSDPISLLGQIEEMAELLKEHSK